MGSILPEQVAQLGAGWGIWCLSQALAMKLYGCSEPSLWRLHSPVSTQVCISPGSLGGEVSAITPRGAQDPNHRVPSKGECSCRAGMGEEDHREVLPGRAIGEQPQGSPLGNTTKGGSQGRTSREHHKRDVFQGTP